ncbi:DUF4097 domain-containing protein [Streptomyces polyrhachis]|uniref:DUF4097 domain-containing protein n=1 Tax=Streptomyces polyrhachis TaxID=1282885 RepID=A0ABW2GGV4_9ACTN
MPDEQQVAGPATIDWTAEDAPIDTLKVRLVSGAVNIVGSSTPGARLEVRDIKGPPLRVSREQGTLTVAYEDLSWHGFLGWLDGGGSPLAHRMRRRRATVSLVVPAGTRVEVGVVDAAAVVSRIAGPVEVRSVSGDATLVGIAGEVRAGTVSGRVEAQAVSGDLSFNSVSGELTVIDGGSAQVRAASVSGDILVDLVPAARAAEVTVNSVSGDAALRLPESADLEVEAHTTGGPVSVAFEGLDVSGRWGARQVSGRIGRGRGKVRVTTVSGAVALLRRPPHADPDDSAPDDSAPDGSAPASGKVL